jgi:aminoglycoside N3'-acetyltransferase
MIAKQQLINELRGLGLRKGDIINAKVSLKAIGTIDGGANTLIDSILDVIGPSGTLICDSFISTHYSAFRWFYRNSFSLPSTLSYAGAFVNAMIKHPQAQRSTHPIQAFTAIGYYATQLTAQFTKESKPYGFLKDISKLNGKNLRIGDKVIGVGTTHIAICDLGFSQKYIPGGVFYIDNGKKKYYKHFWASGCNIGFNKLMPYYYDGGAVLGEGKIGEAFALLTSMKRTLSIEMELFEREPDAYFCNNPACVSCSFTWKHSHYSFFCCIKANLKERRFKRLLYACCVQLFGSWHK